MTECNANPVIYIIEIMKKLEVQYALFNFKLFGLIKQFNLQTPLQDEQNGLHNEIAISDA